jgi:ABC-type bacteriocin/lantibiotic exporter with double-glycine peptidase domain
MKKLTLNQLMSVIGKKNIARLLKFIPLIFTISLLDVIGITSLIPVLQHISGQNIELFNINFDKFFTNMNYENVLYFFLIFILSINLVKFFLILINNYFFNKITLEMQISMQKKILEDYIYGPWFATLDKNTSEKLRDINEETLILKNNLILPFFSILSELLIIFSMGLFLISNGNIKTLAIILISGIICLVFFKVNKTRLFNYGQLRRKYEKIKNQKVLDAMYGLREIKFFNFSSKIFSDFLTVTNNLKNIYLKQSLLLIAPKLILEIVVMTLLMGMIIFLFKQGISFEKIISSMAFYVVAVYKILPSFYKTLNNVQVINFALPTIYALNHVVNRNLKYDHGNTFKKINFDNKIVFRNVSFTYPKKTNKILDDVNITIHKNSFTGIFGESGSGKSTFIDLLTGLIIPNDGQIIIDEDKNKILQESWKKNIGIVTQKIYLFEGSIRENVTIFESINNIAEKKLLNSLKAVNLSKYANIDSLDSQIEENGINLSGGERQRIGLARCLYQNRDIIILDEPTNNLDEKSEIKFYETLKNLKSNKTIIIVSHNKELVNFCDEILYVEEGNIYKK